MPRRGKKTINQVKMKRLRNDLNRIRQRLERMNINDLFVHRCINEHMRRVIEIEKNTTDRTSYNAIDQSSSSSYEPESDSNTSSVQTYESSVNSIHDPRPSTSQFHDPIGPSTSKITYQSINMNPNGPNPIRFPSPGNSTFYPPINSNNILSVCKTNETANASYESQSTNKSLINLNVGRSVNEAGSSGIIIHHFNFNEFNPRCDRNIFLGFNPPFLLNHNLNDYQPISIPEYNNVPDSSNLQPLSVLGYNSMSDSNYQPNFVFEATSSLQNNVSASVLGYSHVEQQSNHHTDGTNQALHLINTIQDSGINNLTSPNYTFQSASVVGNNSIRSGNSSRYNWTFETPPIVSTNQIYFSIDPTPTIETGQVLHHVFIDNEPLSETHEENRRMNIVSNNNYNSCINNNNEQEKAEELINSFSNINLQ